MRVLLGVSQSLVSVSGIVKSFFILAISTEKLMKVDGFLPSTSLGVRLDSNVCLFRVSPTLDNIYI